MKRRVLVFSGDCWHPTKTVHFGLEPLAISGFEFEFWDNGTKWPGKIAPDFPIVILAKANMISETDQSTWLDERMAQAFANHVRHGGGLVAIHAGSVRHENLPAMNALLGGAFVSHPDQCAVTIEPALHPLTVGVTTFTVRDEHYFMSLTDPTVDVFLHSRSEHGIQPAGWARTEGKGRVCVLTPGHNLEVWRHPMFQKLLLNALRWAAERTGK